MLPLSRATISHWHSTTGLCHHCPNSGLTTIVKPALPLRNLYCSIYHRIFLHLKNSGKGTQTKAVFGQRGAPSEKTAAPTPTSIGSLGSPVYFLRVSVFPSIIDWEVRGFFSHYIQQKTKHL